MITYLPVRSRPTTIKVAYADNKASKIECLSRLSPDTFGVVLMHNGLRNRP